MAGRVWAMLGALAALSACASAGGGTDPGADLSAALLARPPAPDAPGCWHGETRPALFETVTDQSVSGTGQVTRVQRQVLVRERSDMWFAVPCEAPSPAFVASLQRALKARGLYALPVTGEADPATAEAVRRFQAARGIDSAVLSLAAAQALGLVAVSPE
ncbi:MAG: peptidoglycan-binding domain-containing protein [Gemmobacter sp.]